MIIPTSYYTVQGGSKVFGLWKKSPRKIIMKHYFPAALFIMLYKVALNFDFVD